MRALFFQSSSVLRTDRHDLKHPEQWLIDWKPTLSPFMDAGRTPSGCGTQETTSGEMACPEVSGQSIEI
jgi:hypothetical protein